MPKLAEFLVQRRRDGMQFFGSMNDLAALFVMTQCLYDLGFTKHLKTFLSSVLHLPNVTIFYFWDTVVPFNPGCFSRKRTHHPWKPRSVWGWGWTFGLFLGTRWFSLPKFSPSVIGLGRPHINKERQFSVRRSSSPPDCGGLDPPLTLAAGEDFLEILSAYTVCSEALGFSQWPSFLKSTGTVRRNWTKCKSELGFREGLTAASCGGGSHPQNFNWGTSYSICRGGEGTLWKGFWRFWSYE